MTQETGQRAAGRDTIYACTIPYPGTDTVQEMGLIKASPSGQVLGVKGFADGADGPLSSQQAAITAFIDGCDIVCHGDDVADAIMDLAPEANIAISDTKAEAEAALPDVSEQQALYDILGISSATSAINGAKACMKLSIYIKSYLSPATSQGQSAEEAEEVPDNRNDRYDDAFSRQPTQEFAPIAVEEEGHAAEIDKVIAEETHESSVDREAPAHMWEVPASDAVKLAESISEPIVPLAGSIAPTTFGMKTTTDMPSAESEMGSETSADAPIDLADGLEVPQAALPSFAERTDEFTNRLEDNESEPSAETAAVAEFDDEPADATRSPLTFFDSASERADNKDAADIAEKKEAESEERVRNDAEDDDLAGFIDWDDISEIIDDTDDFEDVDFFDEPSTGHPAAHESPFTTGLTSDVVFDDGTWEPVDAEEEPEASRHDEDAAAFGTSSDTVADNTIIVPSTRSEFECDVSYNLEDGSEKPDEPDGTAAEEGSPFVSMPTIRGFDDIEEASLGIEEDIVYDDVDDGELMDADFADVAYEDQATDEESDGIAHSDAADEPAESRQDIEGSGIKPQLEGWRAATIGQTATGGEEPVEGNEAAAKASASLIRDDLDEAYDAMEDDTEIFSFGHVAVVESEDDASSPIEQAFSDDSIDFFDDYAVDTPDVSDEEGNEEAAPIFTTIASGESDGEIVPSDEPFDQAEPVDDRENDDDEPVLSGWRAATAAGAATTAIAAPMAAAASLVPSERGIFEQSATTADEPEEDGEETTVPMESNAPIDEVPSRVPVPDEDFIRENLIDTGENEPDGFDEGFIPDEDREEEFEEVEEPETTALTTDPAQLADMEKLFAGFHQATDERLQTLDGILNGFLTSFKDIVDRLESAAAAAPAATSSRPTPSRRPAARNVQKAREIPEQPADADMQPLSGLPEQTEFGVEDVNMDGEIIYTLAGTFKHSPKGQQPIKDYFASKGAKFSKDVTLNCDYLILGQLGSNLWKDGDYGSKVEKALELQQSGKSAIRIVDEDSVIGDDFWEQQ